VSLSIGIVSTALHPIAHVAEVPSARSSRRSVAKNCPAACMCSRIEGERRTRTATQVGIYLVARFVDRFGSDAGLLQCQVGRNCREAAWKRGRCKKPSAPRTSAAGLNDGRLKRG
jgi:hypothetical protein